MNDINYQIACFAQRLIAYDTSFLTRKQVTIDGDVESNPGPIPLEAHRASIGRYYNKSKYLSNIDQFNTNMSCFFSAYLNYLVLHFNKIFGLFLLEFYDSSFLKRVQLLIDGDVESNPGPTQNQNISPGSKTKKKQARDLEEHPVSKRPLIST